MKPYVNMLFVVSIGAAASVSAEVLAAWDFGGTPPTSGGWTAFVPGFNQSSTVNGLTLTQGTDGGYEERTKTPETTRTNAPVLLAAGSAEMNDGFDLKSFPTQSFTLSGLTEGLGDQRNRHRGDGFINRHLATELPPDSLEQVDRFLDQATYRALYSTDATQRFFRVMTP